MYLFSFTRVGTFRLFVGSKFQEMVYFFGVNNEFNRFRAGSHGSVQIEPRSNCVCPIFAHALLFYLP